MELQVITSQRGKPTVLYDGYKFNMKQKNKNSTVRWICVKRPCPGAIVTDSSHSNVIDQKNHSCVPDVAKTEIDLCLQKARKRAREELTPIPQIYRQELMGAKDMGLDFVTQVPEFSSIKNSLYRERHKALGVELLPKSRQEICIPGTMQEYILLDDGEDDRIIAFGYNSEYLLDSNGTYFLDGTFKSCCPLFKQLYTIHVDIGSTEERTCVIPAIYALLPDKETATYKRLFRLLKKKLPNFRPTEFHIDFEAAAINAIKDEFPGAQVNGCNFHFNQALWRKIQQLGLSVAYKNNTEIRDHLKMVAALAYVPREYVSEGWLSIMETSPDDKLLTKFYDYFVDNWIEKTELWICYGNRHRTTNAVEGWHNRFNKRIGKAHPNIYELMKALQEEIHFYNAIYQRSEVHMHRPKRARKYRELDDRLNRIATDLTEGKMDIRGTLKKLVYSVQFE